MRKTAVNFYSFYPHYTAKNHAILDGLKLTELAPNSVSFGLNGQWMQDSVFYAGRIVKNCDFIGLFLTTF